MARIHRRVACIALPAICLEVVEETSSDPLGVIVTRPGSTIQTERDVLGGTKLDEVCESARALGIHRGQTVAAARAKCAFLQVRVVAQNAVHSALVRIAETALAFGPTASFSVADGVVWVEIGGCAHLSGNERELAQRLGARVRALGHVCRIAVADGPRIASAIARFAPQRVQPHRAANPPPLIVPEGKGDSAIGRLPLEALSLDRDTTAWLKHLGLHTCGELQKLPRRSLGTRLGERTHDVMALLAGEDSAPLDAWRPPEVPEERVELDWGASNLEALAFVMKSLCNRLSKRVESRGLAVARLEIVLVLDRTLYRLHRLQSQERELSPVITLDLNLPAPIVRSGDLLAIVRARLEPVSLKAPVVAVTLRASELAQPNFHALDIFMPEPKGRQSLPRLAAELAAEFGETCVGTLALNDTWLPDFRTRLAPFGSSTEKPRHALATSSLEPTRRVPPVSVPRGSLFDEKWLTRIETVQWWRAPSPRRDFFAAWVPYALAWVEVHEGSEKAQIHGWID